jgi:hypothetical protein
MPFAPGQSGNLKGRPKRGQSFADALRLALKERAEGGGLKLRAVATALVDKAMAGDVGAIREIADRLDGRPKSAVDAKVDVQSQPIIIQLSEADLAVM